MVFLRGLVLEYGSDIEYISYTQDRRTKEKTKFNVSKYYDFAMEGIVASSRCLPRRIMALCGVLLLVLAGETIAFFVKYNKAVRYKRIFSRNLKKLLSHYGKKEDFEEEDDDD